MPNVCKQNDLRPTLTSFVTKQQSPGFVFPIGSNFVQVSRKIGLALSRTHDPRPPGNSFKHNVFSWLSNAENAVTVGRSSSLTASGQRMYEFDSEIILHAR